MKIGKTRHITANRCTSCGRLHDAATPADTKPLDVSPRPGSVAVCIACGHIMIFTGDLGLRDPTPDEVRDIAGDPRILAIQRGRREGPGLRALAEIWGKRK